MKHPAVFVDIDQETREVTIFPNESLSTATWSSVAHVFHLPATPGAALRIPGPEFLMERFRLRHVLQSFEVRFEASPGLKSMLEAQIAESARLRALLAGAEGPSESPDFVSKLGSTRFTRELRWFQERDLAKICSLRHGANFSVPGAGKTTVALATYEIERAAGRVGQLLVVAPISAFEAWQEEAEECTASAPTVQVFDGSIRGDTEVLLINYQRLAPAMSELQRWMGRNPTHMILDEAHRMKRGSDGEWGRACLTLGHSADRRDILTGTPAPNQATDLVALMSFLWPFDVSQILPQTMRVKDPDSMTVAAVAERISPLFARTTKSELGLTKPHLKVEYVEMAPLQREIYESLRDHSRRSTLEARERVQFHRLSQVTAYLIQAASNPSLLAKPIDGVGSDGPQLAWPDLQIPDEKSLTAKVLDYGRHEKAAKFKKLVTVIDANRKAGKKTLVWTNFVGNIEVLRDELLTEFQPAVIYGEIPQQSESDDARTRADELNRFRHSADCWVLIANPAAMSEGVSLHHHCNDAVYIDRTFNAGQYLQSIDRIHRLGLEPSVQTNITFLVTEGTIDEIIDARIRTKSKRLADLMSDEHLSRMALPDEELGYGSTIDTDDAPAILEHLLGADRELTQ